MQYWHWERIAAAAAAAFYLWYTPVYLAVCVRTAPKTRFGLGFVPFSPGAALRRSRERAADALHKSALRRIPVPSARAAKKGASDIVSRVSLARFHVWMSAGTGDGMTTALFCAAVNGLGNALCEATRGRARARAYPLFGQAAFRAEAELIVYAGAGRWLIIIARYAAIEIGKRMKTWTSTRLKAS